MPLSNPPLVPGCIWVTERLLVSMRRATKLALPQKLLQHLLAAQVAVVVNLLSKQEYLDAGGDTLLCPLANAGGRRSERQHRRAPEVSMSFIFWPEPGELPSARQVRQATEAIEFAQEFGLRVLVNGVGHPARAALVAGCWLAREGYGGDLADERLRWPEDGTGDLGPKAQPRVVLSEAERRYVSEWPTGREGQPELVDLAWADQDEVFPFAPVEHWLRTLPTVRVYRGTRGRVCPVDAPVLSGQRVSDGEDIDLDLEELRRGTWIGERTLRLPDGWQVVFNSPYR